MEEFWTEHITKTSEGEQFTCDKCHSKNTLHLGTAIHIFVCPTCGKVFSAHIKKYENTKNTAIKDFHLLLPIGAKGELEGILYTVIGYAEKKERNKPYVRWEEYVLYGEDKRIVFLNQINGHWVFITECKGPENYSRSTETIEFEGRTYSYYYAYGYACSHIRGEFPYDVVNLANTKIYEYINAPYFFSAEYKQNDLTFFKGHYIRPRKVKKAFQEHIVNMPNREGIGACQPFLFGINSFKFNSLCAFLILVTFPFVELFRPETKNRSPLTTLSSNYIVPTDGQKIVSESFVINEDASLLRFDSYCNVSNDWAEAEINLINETTGKEQNFFTGVEFYSGYDDEGRWVEGNTSKSDYIGGLEKGRYHIETIFSGASALSHSNYEIAAFIDTALSRNYWICVTLLLSLAILIYVGNFNFEKQKMDE
jgi:predicted RNA-binding Zn-ribbon protein involved in translation (DUF1610 family)